MIALVENLSVLLIFAFAGWLLGRKHILSSENLKLLSVLEIWVFLPCNCLRSFAKNFTVAYIQEKYPLLLLSTGIVIVLTLANAILVPRLVKGSYLQKVIRYTLTPREEKVLRLRFGIEDGRTRTLEEVGKEFNVTRERIRQIEAKALRKLRHPSRSKKLKDFLN